jgi:hypothetical protein
MKRRCTTLNFKMGGGGQMEALNPPRQPDWCLRNQSCAVGFTTAKTKTIRQKFRRRSIFGNLDRSELVAEIIQGRSHLFLFTPTKHLRNHHLTFQQPSQNLAKMPRRKATTATITSLIHDLSDDDLAQPDSSVMLPTPDSSEDKKAPAAKRRVAASSARAKPAAKRKPAAAAATKKRGRPALKDLTNVTEEDEGDVIEEPVRKRAKGVKNADVVEDAPKGKSSRGAAPKAGRAGSAAPVSRGAVIPNTQFDEEEPTVESIEDAAPVMHRATSRARSVSRQPEPLLPQLSSRPLSVSRQAEPLISRHLRAGSANSIERGANEPALRRRLGEVTGKLESLEIKYNHLKDVASTEAQGNFEKLKSATEIRTKSKCHMSA